MKIIYKEREQNYHQSDIKMPLRCRITLSKYDNDILLKKEFFRTGFFDGECDDVVFIPSRYNHENPHISFISIMTQKFEDEKYLKNLENLLIDEYVKECKRLIPLLRDRLEKDIKRRTENIDTLSDDLKFLSNYDRREKLKKINIYDKT